MPFIKGKFTEFELIAGHWKLRTRDMMAREMRRAIREFSKVAAAATPVRTGFARGIFRNIDEATGYASTNGNVPPIDTKKPASAGDYLNSLRIIKKYSTKINNTRKHPEVGGILTLTKNSLKRAGAKGMKFEYYTGGGGRVLKTPNSGRQFATKANAILKIPPPFAKNEADPKEKFVFIFRFRTTITYFNINDFFANARTPSAPWRAFQSGRKALLRYLSTKALQKVPRINDFIQETKVGVSGTTITRSKGQIRGRSING